MLIDTSSMNEPGWFQLDLVSSLGTVMIHPRFTESPVKMALNNMGVYDAVYVLPDQPVPNEPDETVPAFIPPDTCASPGLQPVPPATVGELQTLLTSRWLACSGESVFGADEIGIELAAGGELHKLYRGADGATVIIGHGFGREGTWSVLDNMDTGGPGWHQVNLYIAGAGTFFTFPQVTTPANELFIDNPNTGAQVRFGSTP